MKLNYKTSYKKIEAKKVEYLLLFLYLIAISTYHDVLF